ncbi:MAG: hypothetical protein HY803_16395, partial [candidate division NC10 bacterium]|nr:hypothetical protein [candidate division NC10 bacterium]
LNLILNAIQAMPTGGQITLKTTMRPVCVPRTGREIDGAEGNAPMAGDRGVEVALTDTGPGIPPHLLQDIFNPFFTTKHRGTGLGLSVSRRIVEDHGGWIEAESSPGQGATFRVWLPVGPVTHRTGEPLP